jgi:hypothetical protein
MGRNAHHAFGVAEEDDGAGAVAQLKPAAVAPRTTPLDETLTRLVAGIKIQVGDRGLLQVQVGQSHAMLAALTVQQQQRALLDLAFDAA